MLHVYLSKALVVFQSVKDSVKGINNGLWLQYSGCCTFTSCETPFPPLHCDLCHTNICNACKTTHVSELSKPHEVVPFWERGSTPICRNIIVKLLICSVQIVTFVSVCSVKRASTLQNYQSKNYWS